MRKLLISAVLASMLFTGSASAGQLSPNKYCAKIVGGHFLVITSPGNFDVVVFDLDIGVMAIDSPVAMSASTKPKLEGETFWIKADDIRSMAIRLKDRRE